MTQTIRAFIQDDFLFSGGGITIRVAVQDINDQGWPTSTYQILERNEQGRYYFRHRTDEERMSQVPNYPPGEDPSAITLPEGVGEALLAALARHFHGSTSDQELHADLRHERERRDLLEDRAHDLAVRAADTASSLETALRLALPPTVRVSPGVAYGVGGGGYGGQGGYSG